MWSSLSTGSLASLIGNVKGWYNNRGLWIINAPVILFNILEAKVVQVSQGILPLLLEPYSHWNQQKMQQPGGEQKWNLLAGHAWTVRLSRVGGDQPWWWRSQVFGGPSHASILNICSSWPLKAIQTSLQTKFCLLLYLLRVNLLAYKCCKVERRKVKGWNCPLECPHEWMEVKRAKKKKYGVVHM